MAFAKPTLEGHRFVFSFIKYSYTLIYLLGLPPNYLLAPALKVALAYTYVKFDDAIQQRQTIRKIITKHMLAISKLSRKSP